MSKHFMVSLTLSALCALVAFYSTGTYSLLLWALSAAVWLGVALEELMLYLLTEGDDDAAD